MQKIFVELGRAGSILLIIVVGLFVSLLITAGVVAVMNQNGQSISLQLSLQVAAALTLVGSLTLGGYLTNLILKNDELQEEINKLTTYDSLTGLLNRSVFMERATHLFNIAVRGEEAFSIIIVDIDRFKDVNDTYGHATGDQILANFGKLLRTTLRKSDLGCRYGGEEFALFLPKTNTRQAQEFSERIHQLVKEDEAEYNGTLIKLTLSVGIVSFPKERAISAEGLVNMADQALFHAKKTGRNRTIVYTEGM